MSIFGEPHSLRRYLGFGVIAGMIAGTLAAVFGWNLLFVVGVAVPIAGVLAGLDRNAPIPVLPLIAVAIFCVSLAAMFAAIFKLGGMTDPLPLSMAQIAEHGMKPETFGPIVLIFCLVCGWIILKR